MSGAFFNTAKLTKFALKRERVTSTVWIVLFGLIVIGLVPGMYLAIDAESREALLPILEMPAMIGMMGPAYAVGHYGFGPLYTTMMLLFTAFAAAIMNIFLIARHTRADEEKGRFEVLRSLPVGSVSSLGAAMITAVIVNAVLAIVIALGMYSVRVSGMCFAGSLLWGVSLASVGLVFAAITALFCQLSPSSRGAIGYTFALLGLFYLLRAPGDLNPDLEILSLISPLGLVLRTEAYMSNNWWPIFVLLATACAITALALRFNLKRDIEQGLIPAKPGPASGGLLMKGDLGLTFRLLRPGMIAWIVGMFLLSASYATVLDGIDDFIAGNEMYQMLILGPAGIPLDVLEAMPPEERVEMMRTLVEMAGYTITELFASMPNSMMGMITIVPIVLIILKAKSEEEAARSELILATPVSRKWHLLWYTGFAFDMAFVLQLVLAIGFFVVGQGVIYDPAELTLGFLLRANLVYVPALWVMIGLTVFIYGIRPKLTGIIWGYFAYTFIVVFFGRMGVFPEFMPYLTPIGFVPDLPVDDITALPLIIMAALGIALSALGIFFYDRRDINVV